MDWHKLDTLPSDRPVLLIQWQDVSTYLQRPAEWRHMGAFTAERHDHDKSVVAVSTNRQYWLRGGITRNGDDTLDTWRWAEVPPMPEPLSI